MSYSVTIRDETTLGATAGELTLDFLDERITVRELIRSRVYQEVRDFNSKPAPVFHGLVQPEETEAILNGYRLKPPRRVDWERQHQRALDAFRKNGFVLLVDDRQAESLDEEIDLRHDSQVVFLKLVPLVGG